MRDECGVSGLKFEVAITTQRVNVKIRGKTVVEHNNNNGEVRRVPMQGV